MEAAIRRARRAGFLYLTIIATGLWAERGVRAGLVTPGDAEATAAEILARAGLLRLSMAADLLMVLCDAGVAVLLFLLLRRLAPGPALAALVFRLVEIAVLTANILLPAAALRLAGQTETAPLALVVMELHAFGYDVALGFFGVCTLVLGVIFLRIEGLPHMLGALLAGAGAVYLAGTALRLLAPAALGVYQIAYLLPLLAETAFALWLVSRGGPTIAAALALIDHSAPPGLSRGAASERLP